MSSAFALRCSNEDIWSIPPELKHFDTSLGTAIEALIVASADASLLRRVQFLERECLVLGRNIPFRKLLAMLGVRAIRDPSQENVIHDLEWSNLASTGTSVSATIAFMDSVLDLLGRAREGLFAEVKIDARIMLEVRRCTNAGIKRDVIEFDALHFRDASKRWEYFYHILSRLERAAITVATSKADLTHAQPSPVPTKTQGGPPPAAPLLTVDPSDGT